MRIDDYDDDDDTTICNANLPICRFGDFATMYVAEQQLEDLLHPSQGRVTSSKYTYAAVGAREVRVCVYVDVEYRRKWIRAIMRLVT